MKRFVIPYFAKEMKYVTPFMLGGGIYLLVVGFPVWAGLLILLSVIILTTKYVTEVDLGKRRYRDYLSFLFIPWNDEGSSFATIEKIVVVKERISQMVHTRYRSRQLDWQQFTAVLMMDGGGKQLDLLTRNNKRALLDELRGMVAYLKVEVEDHTTHEPFVLKV